MNQLAELLRVYFLSTAKSARKKDGSYDLNQVRGEVTKIYRNIAQLTHPDKNPNDKYAEELFKQTATILEEIKKAPDQNLVEYLTQVNHPEFGGGGQELQVLVAQAADVVENLTIQTKDLEKRLAQAQAEIVQLRRSSKNQSNTNPNFHSLNPNYVIYQDFRVGIVITIDNAQQIIAQLIARSEEYNKLQSKLTDTQDEIERYKQKVKIAEVQSEQNRKEVTHAKEQLHQYQKETQPIRTENEKLQKGIAKIEQEQERERYEHKSAIASAKRFMGIKEEVYRKKLAEAYSEKRELEDKLTTELKQARDNPLEKKAIKTIRKLRQDGKLEDAMQYCEMILTFDPTNPEINYLTGSIHFDQGDLYQAGVYLNKTLEILPGHVTGSIKLSKIRKELQKKQEQARTQRNPVEVSMYQEQLTQLGLDERIEYIQIEEKFEL